MPSIFDLNSQHQDVDSKIAAALERLSQAFRAMLWGKAKIHNLSPIQIQILVYLLYHREEQATVGQIAREFTLTPATVSDAVKSLEEKELAVRQDLEADRRITSVLLTKEGKKMARKLATWANVVQEHISRFDGQDKMVVMKFLLELIESLQRAGIITVARMCITCKFFQPYAHPLTEEPHHCQLLDKPLANSELRLDCPEHEAKKF